MSSRSGIERSTERIGSAGRLRRGLAALIALAMSAGLLAVGGSAAHAELPAGITQAYIVTSDSTTTEVRPVQPGAPAKRGDKMYLRVSYDMGAKGRTVDFKLGANATIGNPAALKNDAVKSFAIVGDVLRVEFKSDGDEGDPDAWPEITAGVFLLDFTLNADAGPGTVPVSWEVGSETVSVDVEIADPTAPVPPKPETVTEGFGKSAAPGSLNDMIDYEQDGNGWQRVEALKPEIESKLIEYTLTVDVPNGAVNRKIDIEDVLPEGMQYVDANGDALWWGQQVPVTVTGTQWDADGLNPTPVTSLPGFAPEVVGDYDRAFAGEITMSGPAKVTIAYKARITDRAPILTLLQQRALDPESGSYGDFKLAIENVAKFTSPSGTTEKKAAIEITGRIDGPCLTVCEGSGTPGFDKSDDWGSMQREFVTDAAGNIVSPADRARIEYRLKADLSQWDGRDGVDGATNPAFELRRNVVIADELPSQASWSTGDPSFISFDGSSPEFTSLTKFTGACTVADIEIDDNIGSYCVDGHTLLVNVGANKGTRVTVKALAALTTVNGLPKSGSTGVTGGTAYVLRNEAKFRWFPSANPSYDKTDSVDSYPVQLPEPSTDGIKDSNAFRKQLATSGAVRVQPNGQALIDYRFTIYTSKTAPAADLDLVDHLDKRFFDLKADQLTAPAVQIKSASYPGARALTQSDFAFSLNGDGDLVIRMSDAGKEEVSKRSPGGRLVIDLTLQTRQLNGKESLSIPNKATLFGTDGQADYWSEAQAEANSFGSEITVTKRVWDGQDDTWQRFLKARTDEHGNVVQARYVYQIEFRSFNNFTDDAVINVVDQLAPYVEFKGFVTSTDPTEWSNPNTPTVPTQLKSRLSASYDQATHQVRISKPKGTWYQRGATVPFLLMVEVNANAKQVANSLAWNSYGVAKSETVVAGAQPGIDIEKWIDEGAGSGPAYDPSGAVTNDGYAGDYDLDASKGVAAGKPQPVKFTVSNDSTDDLRDIAVSDELTSGVGAVTDLVCVFPDASTGTSWSGPLLPAQRFECSGTIPALMPGQQHTDTVTVSARGEVNPAPVYDTDMLSVHAKSYAVGDYTWIDANTNGMQDPGEPVLPGVQVELLDELGAVVATTKTDARGFYKFDNLAAGTYQLRFTLTEEQGQRYRFTKPNAGDAALDSDAITGSNPLVGVSKKFVLDDSNPALTRDYPNGYEASEGIDPTWDAGVIEVPGGSAGGPLSATGAESSGFLAAALGLLALGGALLMLRRRGSAA